ncbi:M64 family metallopeptidase [Saccharophagus degradans]|uniref:M64 family metallopeptidase n=1 Tax=Saccharophagus degradans TaxID=86304 RepID=A0AAW7X6W8_9GAMM|nr:M64 family metallopeptidase [Saccharophagus degradans]MDO6423310.1 M64 family metallopeptidase [Saccharophagus degradans]MDO6606715.1 M64 family metallopeptidase [Saccharophagus degradans]
MPLAKRYIPLLFIIGLLGCSGDSANKTKTTTVSSAPFITVIYYLDGIETARLPPYDINQQESKTLIKYTQNLDFYLQETTGCAGQQSSDKKAFLVTSSKSCELHVYSTTACPYTMIEFHTDNSVLTKQETNSCSSPVEKQIPANWQAFAKNCGDTTIGDGINITSLPISGLCTIELVENGFDRQFTIDTSFNSATIDWQYFQADAQYEIYIGTDLSEESSDAQVLQDWDRKIVSVSNLRLDNLENKNYEIAFRTLYTNGLTSPLERVGAIQPTFQSTRNFHFENTQPDELLFAVLAEPNIELIPGESRWIPFVLSAGSANRIEFLEWSQAAGPTVQISPSSDGLNITAKEDYGEVIIQGTAQDSLGRSITRTLTLSVIDTPFPKAKLLRGRHDGKGVDLVIAGEAYTASMQDELLEDAQLVDKYAFDDFEEIATHSSLWNVWLIESISETNILRNNKNELFLASDLSEACTSPFSYCPNVQATYNQMTAAVPHADTGYVQLNLQYIIGVAKYLGDFGITYTSSTSKISVHELGHSHAWLKDEYASPEGISGYGINVSSHCFPPNLSWLHWIDDINSIAGEHRDPINDDEVGCFPKVNGGYNAYTPTRNSIMNSGRRFGPVNRERWVLYTWAKARSHFNPQQHTITIGNKEYIALTIAPPSPTLLWSNTWYKNGAEMTHSKHNYVYIYQTDTQNEYSVKATDSTDAIRLDEDGFSRFYYTWPSSDSLQ